ncbi:MAG: L,D-transpeptidase family protein [Rhodospirillales bacterium]|nr:L,D-transpeptidase family protein [Rhodospirillales bacterium]
MASALRIRGFLTALGFLAIAAPLRAAPSQAPLSPAAQDFFVEDWHYLASLYDKVGCNVFVVVDVAKQQLYLFRNGDLADTWPVSTALRGTGELTDSFQTPLGAFQVVRKIGAGLPEFAVLDRHGPTGGVTAPALATHDLAASAEITTRILTLEGLEPGWNEGGDVDTLHRHIYIHGTANLGGLGQPASSGCVQIAPGAMIHLFRAVSPGTVVLITSGIGNLQKISGENKPVLTGNLS